jgi:hypothetical protein
MQFKISLVRGVSAFDELAHISFDCWTSLGHLIQHPQILAPSLQPPTATVIARMHDAPAADRPERRIVGSNSNGFHPRRLAGLVRSHSTPCALSASTASPSVTDGFSPPYLHDPRAPPSVSLSPLNSTPPAPAPRLGASWTTEIAATKLAAAGQCWASPPALVSSNCISGFWLMCI